MRYRITLILVVVGLACAPSWLRAADPEPDCRAARLTSGFTRIAITGQALGLLTGSEDLRLHKVLEMWLSSAVDDTEAVMNEGATLPSRAAAPNLAEAARRASIYARAKMSESLALRLEHLATLITPEEHQAPK